jgi:hypothetical protein
MQARTTTPEAPRRLTGDSQVVLTVLQGARGILGTSFVQRRREMPVLVLLDPALGATATLLRQALGPGFSVAVGSPPEAPPGRRATSS